MAHNFSPQCLEVLARLRDSKNVLVSGAPGTGKSRLLGEVAQAFALGAASASANTAPPVHDRKSPVPIPRIESADKAVLDAMPSPGKIKRAIYRTVFHQNSKNRDFITGLLPNPARKTGEPEFFVSTGTLYRACEHAGATGGAALVVIDEINRGPAVQVFGGSIVAIEADKRLGADGKPAPYSQLFDLINPADGRLVEYGIPEDLYILAAMNQADASVEPLDVAFLRRWEPVLLNPDAAIARSHLGIAGANALTGELPNAATSTQHVFEASIRAWEALNRRIALGRGAEFQCGHGMIMHGAKTGLPIDQALVVTSNCWARLRAHVNEVFFGDIRGVATALNAASPPAHHPLKLVETTFGEDLRYEIQGPARVGPDKIYDMLRAMV